MKQYRTIKDYGEDEIIIEKSKFIGYAKPVKTEGEAQAFIQEIKKKHWDATHNVWAYTLGENMDVQRYSDDGEPSGTAGIPSLEVIKKEDLRDVVVVITRYFGGIKLGAGGLVRAYTKGAKIGLEAGQIIERIPHEILCATVDYTLLGKVQNEVTSKGYVIKDTIYEENVTFEIYCPPSKLEELEELIRNLTSAQAKTRLEEPVYLDVISV